VTVVVSTQPGALGLGMPRPIPRTLTEPALVSVTPIVPFCDKTKDSVAMPRGYSMLVNTCVVGDVGVVDGDVVLWLLPQAAASTMNPRTAP
jgi:hypothetical protein